MVEMFSKLLQKYLLKYLLNNLLNISNNYCTNHFTLTTRKQLRLAVNMPQASDHARLMSAAQTTIKYDIPKLTISSQTQCGDTHSYYPAYTLAI